MHGLSTPGFRGVMSPITTVSERSISMLDVISAPDWGSLWGALCCSGTAELHECGCELRDTDCSHSAEGTTSLTWTSSEPPSTTTGCSCTRTGVMIGSMHPRENNDEVTPEACMEVLVLAGAGCTLDEDRVLSSTGALRPATIVGGLVACPASKPKQLSGDISPTHESGEARMAPPMERHTRPDNGDTSVASVPAALEKCRLCSRGLENLCSPFPCDDSSCSLRGHRRVGVGV